VLFRVVLVLALLAVPAPASAAQAGSATGPVAATSGGLDLLPAPQESTVHHGHVRVPPVVALVRGEDSDPAAVSELRTVLRAAGVREFLPPGRPGPLTVWIAGPGQAPGAAETLESMGVGGPDGLPAGGYVLASRPGRLVLFGADAAGTYHAVQTLRQLLTGEPARVDTAARPARLPAVDIRDWPGMSWRGIIEGFYGALWSRTDRLRHLDRAARSKMNTYVYAPKDDPYHRQRWREPYPPRQLTELGEVAEYARDRHIRFVFAISPGLDVCHSSPADLAALTDKAGALWDVGVRDFALFFDDIGGGLHCEQDERRFGGDPSPLAAAQAHLLERFRQAFLAQHPGAGRLLTVPTEYTGAAGSVYQQRFGELVEPEVLVHWTGPDVVSPEITEDAAAGANELFRHDLLIWDNFPVNDFEPRRLFLGPLRGRAATLPQAGVRGLTANPMVESEPSAIGLLTAADYAWNPTGYQPSRSWRLALDLVGGAAAEALRVFADANAASALGPDRAPALGARIDAFWEEEGRSGKATEELAEWFGAMAAAPGVLRERMGNPAFVKQAEPWLTKMRWYGTAGQAAVRSLAAQAGGDDTTAWRQRVIADRAAAAAEDSYQRVATATMRPFLRRAAASSEAVTLSATPEYAGLTLTAAVRSGSVPIDHVEFYSGDRLVKRAEHPVRSERGETYRFEWARPPTTRHVLRARAVAANGDSVTSAEVRLTVGDPAPALLVVGDVAAQAAGDVAVRDRLEELGLPVVVRSASDTTAADAQGKALVAVSSTVASGDVATKFTDAPVPVLAWESFVFDDLGLASEVGETWRVSQVEIGEEDSPLAAGLTGTVDVYKGPNRLRWGVPPETADRAAVLPGDPEKATLFGYSAGEPMVGLDAPATRVALFLGDDGLDPAVVTPEAVRLFDAAVCLSVATTCATGERSTGRVGASS
jgi:hypothetical protein